MAAVKMDNRAKLAVGIILTLVAIGLVHYFVFRRNMKEFEQARRQYSNVFNQARDVKRGNQTQLNEYAQKTKEFAARIKEVKAGLDLDWPPYFQPVATPPPDHRQKQREYLRRELFKLFERRATGEVKMDFLGDAIPAEGYPAYLQDIGWHIPTALPGDFQAEPAKLADALDRLKQTRKLLRTLDASATELLMQYRQEYNQTLLQIGINEFLYPAMVFNWQMGRFLPLYNLLAHTELILEKLPSAYSISRENREELESLLFYLPNLQGTLAVDYPDNFRDTIVAVRQLETLNDLLDRAAKDGVVAFTRVRFFDGWMYHEGADITSEMAYQEQSIEQARRAEGGGRRMDPGMMEDMMMGDGGEVGRDPLAKFDRQKELSGAAARFGGAGGGGAEGQTVLAPVINVNQWIETMRSPGPNWVGAIVPVEVTFQANNSNALRYLYHLANSERAYELHSINFQINEAEASQVIYVRAVILAFAWIDQFSGVSQPAEAAAPPNQ